jgi:glutamine synthetase
MAGNIDVQSLEQMANAGEIDTVLCMFTDLQGRFMGKRVAPWYFLEHILGHEGLHACLYLVTVDMAGEVLQGFRFAGWRSGYGDFKLIPDLSTMRRAPWLEKTAVVICDVADEHSGEPVEVAPRQILRRQVERAQQAGFRPKMASELEFYLFRDSYEDLATRGYRDATPSSAYGMDYHMLQTTRDESVIRKIRNDMLAANIPIEFSKGETGRGQHEINIQYADALEAADNHVIYKHGTKEIAMATGAAITFMAKWNMAEAGSSCHIHSSLWDKAGTKSLMWDETADDHLSPTFRHYLGGLMSTAREMSVMFAPFVNSYKRYQQGTWAPTAIVWGRDNRTCGFRPVGEGRSYRVENRIPGADANVYLAFAATIAGGLHGLENKVEPPDEFIGNAYTAEDVPRVPTSLHEAVVEFEESDIARAALGEAAFEHIATMMGWEQTIFDNNVVTDWEVERYFEQG